MFALFRKSLGELNPNHVQILSAALAFFLVFSLAPLITIAVAVAGIFFSAAAIRDQIVEGTARFVGAPAGELVKGLLENSASPAASGMLALASFAVLLYAASRIFWQLRVALNIVWGIMPDRASLRARLISMAIVPVVGLVLAAAMLFSAFAGNLIDGPLKPFFAEFAPLARILSMLVAPAIYFAVFGAIFRYMPHVRVGWTHVWPGAAVTAGLFWAGNRLIWLYLEQVTFRSVYGAAGSILVFLMWMYFTSWIVLFGAKYTQVHAEHNGAPIPETEPGLEPDYFAKDDGRSG